MSIQLPVDELNARLAGLGRRLDDSAEVVAHKWNGDEYELEIKWADGFTARVGMGKVASAVIESVRERKH